MYSIQDFTESVISVKRILLPIYDMSVRSVHSSFAIPASSLVPGLGSTPVGVRVARLAAAAFTATQKLVVQK